MKSSKGEAIFFVFNRWNNVNRKCTLCMHDGSHSEEAIKMGLSDDSDKEFVVRCYTHTVTHTHTHTHTRGYKNLLMVAILTLRYLDWGSLWISLYFFLLETDKQVYIYIYFLMLMLLFLLCSLQNGLQKSPYQARPDGWTFSPGRRGWRSRHRCRTRCPCQSSAVADPPSRTSSRRCWTWEGTSMEGRRIRSRRETKCPGWGTPKPVPWTA